MFHYKYNVQVVYISFYLSLSILLYYKILKQSQNMIAICKLHGRRSRLGITIFYPPPPPPHTHTHTPHTHTYTHTRTPTPYLAYILKKLNIQHVSGKIKRCKDTKACLEAFFLSFESSNPPFFNLACQPLPNFCAI